MFTQDQKLIQNYLQHEPGRWDVMSNRLYWGDAPDDYDQKFRVVASDADVGLDVEGRRLTFTKNPLWPILKNSCVVVDLFNFPAIEHHDIYPPLTLISKLSGKTLAIVPSSPFAWSQLQNQLVLQDINQGNNLKLLRNVQFIEGFQVVAVYKLPIVSHIMALDRTERVCLIGHKTPSTHRIDRCEAIMACLARTPQSAVTFQWLALQTAIHPRNLLETLEFLVLIGCAREVHPDNEVVIIEKRGDQPEDLEFHSIPPGTWYVRQIAGHLKVDRDEVFPLLKKWENKGIVFSYAPSSHGTMWTVREALDRDRYRKAMDALDRNQERLTGLMAGGSGWLMHTLTQKAERHAKEYRMAFYVGEEAFSPTATSLIDMAP